MLQSRIRAGRPASAADRLPPKKVEARHGRMATAKARAPTGRSQTASTGGELLGKRLRQLRRERSWTLAKLSASTGLSISTLSKVENNQLSLTYTNLAKLALGLDIDIAQLFTSHVVEEAVGMRAHSTLGQGRLHESSNYAHHYLFAELSNRRMIPIFTKVKARSIEEFGELIQHPGQEFLFVLEGAIDLYIEPDGPVRMRAGDSCYFDAKSKHAAISVGVGEATILSVISALTQGAKLGAQAG